MDGGKGGERGENRNAEKDSITHNEGKEDTGLGWTGGSDGDGVRRWSEEEQGGEGKPTTDGGEG